ncbi:hypothetical protein ACC680_27905 [Rhizobium ruizarguesonis]
MNNADPEIRKAFAINTRLKLPAITVERFFADAQERLVTVDEERRQHLAERLTLARAMMGNLNPLDLIESWLAPEERYRSKLV